MVSADKKSRGIWNQHVYFVRSQTAAPSVVALKSGGADGDQLTAVELVSACAEPPVPDYTMMLSGSKALREACDLIELVKGIMEMGGLSVLLSPRYELIICYLSDSLA
jgi:hypothetical protein